MVDDRKINRMCSRGTLIRLVANNPLYLRIALALLMFLIGVLYLIYEKKVDEYFLYIITGAIVLVLVPIELVNQFKFGPVELHVLRRVEDAIDQTGKSKYFDKQALKGYLTAFSPASLAGITGGRIIWIDDWPQTLVGSRRIIRALNLEIITATSSNQALDILIDNPDVDLIITDVQRAGDSYDYLDEAPAGELHSKSFTDRSNITWYRIHEGVNFVVRLHEDKNIYGEILDERVREMTMSYVKQIPVIFYAAYDRAGLESYTLPARLCLTEREVDICNTVQELVQKVILRLIEVRTRSIIYTTDKIPTKLRKWPKARDEESIKGGTY